MANPDSNPFPFPFPFPFLENLIQSVRLPEPPTWLVEEVQRRGVLLINHVLMQEPQATQRLVRQQGQVILARWRNISFKVQVTPAGLFDLADAMAPSDLSLEVSVQSPWQLAQAVAQGQKPAVRIEGDVQLAAEVNWLADNVRWDMEEDLARILGDAPAHLLVQAVETAMLALRGFLGARLTDKPLATGFGGTAA